MDFVCLFSFFLNNPLQRCTCVEFPSGQITDQSTQREAPSWQAQSEVYALTYVVLGALSLYLTSSFFIQLLMFSVFKDNQDHECSFNIQLIYTRNLMPTLFFSLLL